MLKLLRCGAHVIVSTRFPHDAVARYAALPDYSVWKDRLHVYGLDLRDLPQLERYAHTSTTRLFLPFFSGVPDEPVVPRTPSTDSWRS